jgi:dolichyl-phosphate-mannose-protein mannosyltransferase
MSTPEDDRPSDSNPRRPMFTLRWWTLPAVTIPAFLLRLLHVGSVVNFLDDRYVNAPGALNFMRYGMPGPDNWFTQPAKHVSMFLSIALFGNDPFGWSMRQVLFGTGVVVLTFLLARRIFRVPFPAIFAAVVVALDPTWIVFSRAGSEDPPAVFFMLAALLLWTRAIQDDNDWDLLGAGVLIGLAAATRWYAGLVAVLMLVIALVQRRRDGSLVLGKTGALLGAVPIAAYMLPFLPWIARGNTLADLWSLQTDSFLVQQTGAYPAFDSALAPLIGPAGWFTRWLAVWTSSGVAAGRGSFTVMMNDPVIWWLFIPAVGYVCWVAWRRRAPELLLLGGSFIILYGFFVSVERPIYLYSALSIVPLGAMATGFAAGRLLRRWSLALLGAVVVWSAYLYPLTSAVSVPVAPYAWLLSLLGVTGVAR